MVHTDGPYVGKTESRHHEKDIDVRPQHEVCQGRNLESLRNYVIPDKRRRFGDSDPEKCMSVSHDLCSSWSYRRILLCKKTSFISLHLRCIEVPLILWSDRQSCFSVMFYLSIILFWSTHIHSLHSSIIWIMLFVIQALHLSST